MSKRTEIWVVQSENHLKRGSLAYWGPYESREVAEKEFRRDKGAVVVEVPSLGKPKTVTVSGDCY